MDTAYLSVAAALAGSAIGGLTSLANAWLTQHAQARAQQRAYEQAKREELYGQFIAEASKLYADALQHQTEEASALVSLYALIGRIRLRSSPEAPSTRNSWPNSLSRPISPAAMLQGALRASNGRARLPKR